MRAFACPRCGQLVFFENDQCLRCHAALGYDSELGTMVLVGPDHETRRCGNRKLANCNWLLPEPAGAGTLCTSCRLTRTRPSDADFTDDPKVAARFVRAEAAKRRLVFQLLELELLKNPVDKPLAFDFLVRKARPITIGHAEGVITLDLAESDDAYRERMRAELDEPYRTMLGHLRHEVGHYFWEVLVEPNAGVQEQFRSLFGDERADYQDALRRHYNDGPPPVWANDHVSAYAAAHPWEDWAETWAHYLHIRDTLQTAASYGVIVTGPKSETGLFDPKLEPYLMAAPRDDADSADDIAGEWLPLIYALNAINRSMGKEDLYPFVLCPRVIEKLRFVDAQI
ncbi:MAG: hypothetical protein QOK39_1784 [Acidimicrobiaceae bacterium]|nr:hypothetical protein [Acidimicrobiaceae bacterium]